MNKYLLSPGPVPVGTEASLASARPMISHRSAEFHKLFGSIQDKFSRLLGTSGPIVVFPSSGTGALEALAVNFCSSGTRVLSASCGVFGDRWREICARTGAEIVKLDVRMGGAVTPDALAKALNGAGKTDIVLVTMNETSTGVLNPIKEIAASLPTEDRPLLFVDGVSGIGTMPCRPEEWGIDGLAFTTQKGLLTPPGLGIVWLSKRAWERLENRETSRSYYFDLLLQRKYLKDGAPENPYTPPISVYHALDAALTEILAEPDWFDLHADAARALAAGAEALGFEVLARDPAVRSAGVTALGLPNGDITAVHAKLKEMGVMAAGGMGALKGKIIRVAHYHDVRWPEVSMILCSLYAALGGSGGTEFIDKAYRALRRA